MILSGLKSWKPLTMTRSQVAKLGARAAHALHLDLAETARRFSPSSDAYWLKKAKEMHPEAKAGEIAVFAKRLKSEYFTRMAFKKKRG